ncbi:MAG: HAMP domain-containing protein [Rhizobiaceae bacterium]|nr:HAMP domain-containing protein [Rhizobiaceae bacterium]
MNRLRQLLSTTAVRLTLIYTILFGILAVGVVAYVSYNTGRLIISQIQSTVDEEIAQIARQSRRGGVRQLIPMIERRSRQPGANLYLVADASGRIIAGNVRDLDREILLKEGWQVPPFDYLRYGDADPESKAIAKVFILPGGLRLLVGRDIGDAERFRHIVGRASTFSLFIMVLTGLVLWFLVGRRALKHIDSVSRSSQRIIDGDLSQRLPLSGSGDEFDRLSSSLNGLIERVEKLNTGVSVMSDSIAHDLKTPLTRLRNRAEAALDKPHDESVIQDIIADADGLINTFNALLMISQVETGARAVQFEQHQLAPILRDVHELFEPSAEELDIELVLDIDAEPTAHCSRELIAQALTNLLDNALKYGLSADQPKIEIRLFEQKGAPCISVCDNGPGVPEDQKQAVTERFVRLDASRTKPGSGLGLALVKAVASLHSGKLDLSDNQPGLCAEICLPRTA